MMAYAAETGRLGEYEAEIRKRKLRIKANKNIARICFGINMDRDLAMRQNAREAIIKSKPI
jgi:hypothetical protein